MYILHKIAEQWFDPKGAIQRLSAKKPDLSLFCKALLTGCSACNYFDFGSFDFPDYEYLQDDAIMCWNEGLLDFPFETCCFNHSYIDNAGISGQSLYFIMSENKAKLFDIRLPDILKDKSDVYWISEIKKQLDDYFLPMPTTALLYREPGQSRSKPQIHCAYQPNSFHDDIYNGVHTKVNHETFALEMCSPILSMAMFLNVEGVSTRYEQEPVRLNKHRIKAGKFPIKGHHIVILNPLVDNKSADLDGTHASPRPHYRRGHIRRLQNGQKIWIKSCIVAAARNQVPELSIYEVKTERVS
jgi:hypothetical protein